MNSTYLDSSAAFKLVVYEAESPSLAAFLETRQQWSTSRLTVLEVGRAVRRTLEQPREIQAELAQAWKRFLILETTAAIWRSAEILRPPLLRSLDAIQLATALSLGEDLAGVVAYDRQLLEAAAALGLQTWSPC